MRWKGWMVMALLVLPASGNYRLDGYSLGNAGGGQVGSSQYSVNSVAGELGGKSVGNSYDMGGGLSFVLQANVPKIASFSNPGGTSYNKLHFVLDKQNNPVDTKYALAISSDDFVTTQYVKSDLTVGSTLAWADYQTYSDWGGASGSDIIGLESGKTYRLKARAIQGKFTETGWGPDLSALTVSPTLVFDIDVSTTDSETDPPYDLDMGDLFPGSVVDSSQKIWVDVETNAVAGATVFLYGKNAGLYSLSVGYTIAGVTADLSLGGVSQGFGVQGLGTTESSGSSLTLVSPYDGGGDTVGVVDTAVRRLFVASGPLIGGRGWLTIKAKSSTNAPTSNDYNETMTLVASGCY